MVTFYYIILSALTIVSIAVSATTYYVSQTATQNNTPCNVPNGAGSSCANACGFQNALDEAQADGDDSIIKVCPGTYTPPANGFSYTKLGGDGILTIEAEDPNNKPVLDGKGTNKILLINTQDTNNIPSDTGNTINIRNLIFRNGYASTLNPMRISTGSADVNITGCNIEQSQGSGAPFAIHALNASISVTESVFKNNKNNSVSGYGGGLITSTTYTSKVASPGNKLIIDNNYFLANQSNNGGALVIIIGGPNEVLVRNNIFANNRDASSSTTVIERAGAILVRFDNFSEQSKVYLINNTIYNNRSDKYGGLLFDILGSPNKSLLSAYIYNNIFWQNSEQNPSQNVDIGSTFTLGTLVISNNNLSSNDSLNFSNNYGSNNLSVDPQFVNTAANDLHIKSNSQMIDKGSNAAPNLPITDFEGNSRSIDGNNDGNAVVDIGADEYNPNPNNNPPVVNNFNANPNQGNAPLQTTFSWNINDPDGDPLTCHIDVNNDGTVEQTINNCSNADNYQYTYQNPGTYTAKLTVSDGTTTVSKITQVTVNQQTAGGAGNSPVQEFRKRKLPDGTIIKIEGGVFSSLSQLSGAPINCYIPNNTKALTNWLRFIAKVDTSRKGVWISLTLPEPIPAGAKIGKCTREGYKEIPDVDINGNTIRFFIEDGGEFDYDGRKDGYVRDPLAVVIEETQNEPQPQPQPQPESEPERSDTLPTARLPSGGGGCNTGGSILPYLLIPTLFILRKLK